MTQSHIILVRHGEPSASWSEHPDPGLSKRGLNQAEKTSKNFSFDFESYQLFSSPKKRAIQTMECIAKEINQSFEIDDRFIEMINSGAIEEVRDFKKKNFRSDFLVSKAVGFQEISAYLDGKINLTEATKSGQQAGRRHPVPFTIKIN